MTVQNFITMDVPKDAIPKDWLHCDLGNFRRHLLLGFCQRALGREQED